MTGGGGESSGLFGPNLDVRGAQNRWGFRRPRPVKRMKIVVRLNLGPQDMNNDIARVHERPIPQPLPFEADAPESQFSERLRAMLRQGQNMAARFADRHHHVIRQRTHPPPINRDNVLGLMLIQNSENARQPLFRQPAHGRPNGLLFSQRRKPPSRLLFEDGSNSALHRGGRFLSNRSWNRRLWGGSLFNNDLFDLRLFDRRPRGRGFFDPWFDRRFRANHGGFSHSRRWFGRSKFLSRRFFHPGFSDRPFLDRESRGRGFLSPCFCSPLGR